VDHPAKPLQAAPKDAANSWSSRSRISQRILAAVRTAAPPNIYEISGKYAPPGRSVVARPAATGVAIP
jgi:hypothetical protein